MTLHTNKKPIGGEQELLSDSLYYGATNSGRSSLRWAIKSMGLSRKKILVPNFICQTVIDLLSEQEATIDFYRVKPDLNILLDPKSLANADAVYLVRYFGVQTASLNDALSTLQIPFILDDVFGVSKPIFDSACHWSYFNSFRKVSAVAGYSQLISNRELASISTKDLPGFDQLKYKAKDLKAKYLADGLNDQASYLVPFNRAEKLLDTSSPGIYRPSGRSSILVNEFFRTLDQETLHRQNNLALAKNLLPKHFYINIAPEFPSFLPIVLQKRDAVRKRLMQYQVFLAIHWPQSSMTHNQLSDCLLSLPLDSRYSSSDIERVCNLIMQLSNEF